MLLYQMGTELQEITIKQLNSQYPTIGLMSLEELKVYYDFLGFAERTLQDCQLRDYRFRSNMENDDCYSFGLLGIVQTENPFLPRDRMAFYLKHNLFLLISIQDKKGRGEDAFLTTINLLKNTNPSMERLVYTFLEQLIVDHNKLMEQMEFEISGLESRFSQIEDSKEFNSTLHKMRKKLLLMRNYYQQLMDIGESLQKNDNGIFEGEHFRLFTLLITRVARLSDNVLFLREEVVQLREEYEAFVTLNTNNIMKLFTVVTTIFMPLTLIVGWYGMNFTTMPELHWQYGYLFVILLSLGVIVGTLCLFKRKKLL